MNKEKLMEDLFNKVPENSRIIIFGACPTGKRIMEDLAKFKPNAKVIGFVDNSIQGTYCNLPVYRLKKAIELRNNYDLVIMSTKSDEVQIINIFDIYDIPVVPQTTFVSDYYRQNLEILSEENYLKVISIFDKQEDKDLYTMIFNIRKNILDLSAIENYFYKNVSRYKILFAVKEHYLDKINKQTVKTLLDAGMYDGMNVVAYNKQLPNLDKIYAFEVLYDYVRKSYIEDFILNDKLEIIPELLGDCCKKIKFCIDKTHLSGSFAEEITDRKCPTNSPNWENKIVDVITIDEFCNKRNIIPDLIKMDIEGAELSALKGGADTIRKHRPQLAISIYHHSSIDFVTIPLYLKDTLKNYKFTIGHYSPRLCETVLYAIPQELVE